MVQGNLLEISYKRITNIETIELTASNCEGYGYHSTKAKITVDGVEGEYTVYYKWGNKPEEYVYPNEFKERVIDGVLKKVAITYHEKYTETPIPPHVAPACSGFKISFADVDKEGSGRNSLTGEMFRERIGSYIKVDLTWDLIPNTIEYNNWYKVLTHLPPTFNCKMLMPSGNIETKEFYRGDISTTLHLFVSNRQIWTGLSTTFTQTKLDEYNDMEEPDLEKVTGDGITTNPIFENGDNLSYGD